MDNILKLHIVVGIIAVLLIGFAINSAEPSKSIKDEKPTASDLLDACFEGFIEKKGTYDENSPEIQRCNISWFGDAFCIQDSDCKVSVFDDSSDDLTVSCRNKFAQVLDKEVIDYKPDLTCFCNTNLNPSQCEVKR